MAFEIDADRATQFATPDTRVSGGDGDDAVPAATGADALTVLRTIWASDGQGSADLDDDCGPTKTCRNMREVTFDGFAEPGDDMGAAWRATLAREGKLREGSTSVRDLVLGPNVD
jgi:hypothetical protein